MRKIGYAYSMSDDALNEQIATLEAQGVDEIVVERGTETTENSHANLDVLTAALEPGDYLVVKELRNIGKSIVQLSDFINELKTKEANLIVLEKAEELSTLTDEAYAQVILSFAKMEKEIIRERTSRGLELARQKGRIGGRPKISQETVERIQHLYNNNKYTLRQIAEECQISLGTAYKYTQGVK